MIYILCGLFLEAGPLINIIAVLILSWCFNYIIGILVSFCYKKSSTLGHCQRVIFVFLIFALLLTIVILIHLKNRDGLVALVFFVGVWALDAICFDTLIVAILYCNCFPNLRKCLSTRGYAY